MSATATPLAGGAAQGLARRNLAAVLVGGGVTAVVQVGVFLAARWALSPDAAAEVTVFAGLLWIVIASPIFAAGGERLADSLVRGAAVADGGAVVLIVLVAATDAVGFTGAIKLYLLWMSISLATSAITAGARRPAGRCVAAAAAIVLIVALSAGPFWANALLAAREPWRGKLAEAVVAVNPVYASSQCLAADVGFVWHEKPILYARSVLGRDIPMPALSWVLTTVIYGLMAAIAGAGAFICRREKRPPSPV